VSLEAVLAIVERATADEAFRGLLLGDPTTALRGETLTPSERAMLKGLGDSPYASSPRGLDDVRKMVLASMAYGEQAS
jgi:hypothetical protein